MRQAGALLCFFVAVYELADCTCNTCMLFEYLNRNLACHQLLYPTVQDSNVPSIAETDDNNMISLPQGSGEGEIGLFEVSVAGCRGETMSMHRSATTSNS